MIRNKLIKTLLTLLMALTLVFAMSACGGSDTDTENSESEAVETEAVADDAQAEIDALMEQVAAKEIDLQYKDFLPDAAFAKAEVFGADEEGDEVTLYTVLCTGEYVALKGKAYSMSGSQGEAIIKYKKTDEGPVLEEIIWSADGTEHDKWVEENFPKEYLDKAKSYEGYDADGKSLLQLAMQKDVAEAMDVEVETENILEIDKDAGTYKVVKTTESGDPASDDYKFDTEVVDEGLLSDVNS